MAMAGTTDLPLKKRKYLAKMWDPAGKGKDVFVCIHLKLYMCMCIYKCIRTYVSKCVYMYV